jgi:hypothetical protein
LLSYCVGHNCENRILNGYHMSEIIHFKFLLLCEMIWQMLDRC